MDFFWVFFKLGFFGFGGPIAGMAMLEEEACRKRGWISPAHFSEMYAVFKITPGPLTTQMVVHIGALKKGIFGGVSAGLIYILPSFFMILALAVYYQSAKALDGSAAVLTGLQVGALVVILTSTVQLGKPHSKELRAWAIALASGVFIFFIPRVEPLVIFGFGFLGAILASSGGKPSETPPSGRPIHLFMPLILSGAALGTLGSLFWVCFKAGAFVFGTGLAIVPMLEAEVVRAHHWVTHSEFMDGIAFGQITPGPVVITATFIGYKAAGLMGAVIATVGIFLPAFCNVLFIIPKIMSRVSGTPGALGFASLSIPSVVGCILATALRLGMVTLADPISIGLFVVLLIVAFWKSPPAWLLIPIAGGVCAWAKAHL